MLGYEKKHILLENTKAAKLVSEQYLDQYGINYCVLFVEGQRMFRDSIYNTATDTRDDFTIANRTGFVIANSGDTLYYKDLFSCPGGANNLFFECKQDSNYL